MKIKYIPLKEKRKLGKYLWKVQTPTATVYLLGTVHLLPEKLFPLKSSIIRAFDSCDNFVCEILLDDTQLGIVDMGDTIISHPKYSYPKGEDLYQYFDHEKVAQLKKDLVKAGFCSPPIAKQFHKLTPNGINTLILSGISKKAGMDPSKLGIDHYFIKRAQARNKNIIELESIDFQKEILAKSFNLASSDDLLTQTSKDCNQSLPELTTFNTTLQPLLYKFFSKLVSIFYKNIDLFSSSISEDDPLIGTRNIDMAKKIDSYLKSNQSYFVAVGALHLVGPKNIIQILEKQNYTSKEFYKKHCC